MKFNLAVVLLVLVTGTALWADQTLFDPEEITPIQNYSVLPNKATDTVLITPDANWRGIVQPGRNIIVKGDTVSVVYSQTTTDPNDFQIMYHAYSTDGGANWTPAQVGTGNCMRTYPHQMQMWDESPFSATAYVYWMERYYPGTVASTYFAYDELTPFQLFTPVVTINAIAYFVSGTVWADSHCFGTGYDWNSHDIYGFTSPDLGSYWDSTLLIPAGSATGQVSPMCDRGDDGYIFLYYGRQEVANSAIDNHYIESTDYGQTWSSPHQMMIVDYVDTLGNVDTLSLTWQGYSVIVDYYTKIPYVLAKLDYHKDPNYSYNFGEIYFTKPNGGSPGAWTFDSANPVTVIDNDPNTFEHLAGYPTIGYYYDVDTNIVLYGFCLAFVDTMGSTPAALMGLSSTDEGNTWDVQIASPFLSDSFNWYFPSASYYLGSNNSVHVVCIKEGTHNDTDHLNMYHISLDVVNDLGLPTPGPYTVGVEEQLVDPAPSGYRINYSREADNFIFNLALPTGGITTLKIYDASGREINQLVNGYLSAGNYSFNWNQTVPAGNYLYKITSGGFTHSGKIQIVQ
ncbi:MAG: T9SS type A sorting domain-containing protein [bacterium]